MTDAGPAPAAAVLVFPGSNGERDLCEALELAGFVPRLVDAGSTLPRDVALVGLPGGFSFGDYWRAGLLAGRCRAVLELPRFLDGGGLALGVCNGFQILVAAGLLPGALAHNAPPHFVHRWVTVQVTAAATASPWFTGLAAGTGLRLPIAHGEGRYLHPDGDEALARCAALTYCKNPNGSQGDAAAVLDATRRVLGIMPHPERAIDELLGSADGLRLLRAARASLLDGRARAARGA
ncbi:MAG: phosphoribosylformylglycinamidine synthase I [Polyangia bacterium]